VTLTEFSILAVAGVAGGIANAVAGGGTFFTFAALVAFGISTLEANATSAIALVPGSLAVGFAYRKETAERWRELVPAAIISVIGGAAGGALLIAIGDARFRPLVPWLLGSATLLFAMSGRIRDLVRVMAGHQGMGAGTRYAMLGTVAVYGGFFGAGMGIMLLAALALAEAGNFDFHKANATKNVVATLSQSLAVMLFVIGGLVHWLEAIIICVGATAGGYYGIYLARRVPVAVVRAVVVVVGAALTLVFFLR
jgi:uncharacterized membrane protein YfcA